MGWVQPCVGGERAAGWPGGDTRQQGLLWLPEEGRMVVGAAARGSARDGALGAAALLEGDPANGGGCRWLCAWEKEEAAWRRSGWISGEYHGEDDCVGIGKR